MDFGYRPIEWDRFTIYFGDEAFLDPSLRCDNSQNNGYECQDSTARTFFVCEADWLPWTRKFYALVSPRFIILRICQVFYVLVLKRAYFYERTFGERQRCTSLPRNSSTTMPARGLL
jgi:hypothetical protein